MGWGGGGGGEGGSIHIWEKLDLEASCFLTTQPTDNEENILVD